MKTEENNNKSEKSLENKNGENKSDNPQAGKFTKDQAKSRAFENMVIAATLIGLANGWTGLDSHKTKFTNDPSITDKSPEAFVKWMVNNVSKNTTFNIIHGLLHYKVLPPHGQDNTTIVDKNYVEL